MRLSAADARRVAETIPHIVWIADSDGTNRYLNRQGRVYTGTTSDAIGASRWGLIFHPDDVDRARRAWVYATPTETPFRLDYRIRKFDGTYRWHAFSGLPSRDVASGVVSWIGTAPTRRCQVSADRVFSAERETAEALTLLEKVVSTAPFGFAFVDRDCRYVHLNETLAAINGSTVAADLGRTVSAVVPRAVAAIEPLYRRALDLGEAVLDLEVDGPSPGDPTQIQRWSTSYYPVSLEGEVIGVGVVVADITERKEGEDARRQLSAIVDGSGDAIFGATTDGTITSWNAAADAIVRVHRGGDHRSLRSMFIASRARRRAGGRTRLASPAGAPPEQLETTRLRKDGSLVEVLITASTGDRRGRDGGGLSVIAHDITERRAAAARARGEPAAAGRGAAHRSPRQLRARSRHRRDDLVGGALPDPRSRPDVDAEHRDCSSRWSIPTTCARVIDAWDERHRARVSVRPRVSHHPRRLGGALACAPRVVPEVGDDGTVVKLVGTMMDDTERVEADRVRRAAETRFEIGFEQAAIGAVIADLDGIPIRVNPALVRAPRAAGGASCVGQRWTEYTHPDEVPLGRVCVPATGRRPRHLRGRAALPAAGRHRRVGVVPRHARARRVGAAPVLLHAAPGHHRAQADGAGARPPGAARLAHRPARTGRCSPTAWCTAWPARGDAARSSA